MRDSGTSTFIVNKELNTIRKKVNQWLEFDVLNREVYWYKLFTPSKHIPKYVDSDKESITIEYVGNLLTKQNLPDNWKEQIEEILSILKDNNCSHNDIRPANLLVNQEVIYLIDFQWSTKLDEPIPENWPSGLGCEFKSKDGFDDRYSIYKSIESL
jgi:thiamine kinase-like enzyme